MTGDIGSFRDLYRSYKRKAIARNYNFDLDLTTFGMITKCDCYYCGAVPANEWRITRNSKNTARYIYNGIDRKDNTKGYQLDNVVSCCSICNFMKNTLTYDQFIAKAMQIAIYQNTKDNNG